MCDESIRLQSEAKTYFSHGGYVERSGLTLNIASWLVVMIYGDNSGRARGTGFSVQISYFP